MNTIADSYGYDVPAKMTRKQAIAAVLSHGADVAEFDAEHAMAADYAADLVMTWLGY